jgi:hypothetical protein
VPVGAQLHGSGIGQAFRITSDAPVVAYQMLPYGGGVAAVTGASLLVPTSAWDASYVAVNPIGTDAQVFGRGPSLDIVAAEDDTAITMVPSAPIAPDVGVPSGVAHRPVTFALDRGQVLQLTQGAELSGSTITSNRPIGFWGGHQCTNMPLGPKCCCDHAEQQIPPVRALGSEYVAVPHRPRLGGIEPSHWRLVGAAAGTTLAYDPPNAGPATLELGQVAEFTTTAPFVVRSQDGTHPFVLLAYMTSADAILSELGYGDADFVRVVPPAQYLDRYVFFTDPTYPETNLVVVRKGSADVTLDCRGAIDGWAPIGDGNYSYARVDLVRHDFQPQAGCDNGRREMSSTAPFGLWVWGWGTPETVPSTGYVSYGYPAGEGLILINDVELPPVPK